MEVWKKIDQQWVKKQTSIFPNARRSLAKILYSQFLDKGHHWLVFTPIEEKNLLEIVRSLLEFDEPNRESIRRFLEIFLKAALGKMSGPIPVEVTMVKERGIRKALFAFEFYG